MPQALPIEGPSAAPAGGSGSTILRVVSNSELDQHAAAVQAAQALQVPDQTPTTDLNQHIREQWTQFRNHRNTAKNGGSLNDRLLRAQRMFDGKYDPDKLAEISKFGGSQVYSRLVAVKCRGATSLLRDVYLGADRPWEIQPQSDPPVPPDVMANITKLVSVEVGTLQMQGQQVPAAQAHTRLLGLVHAAREAARRAALTRAGDAEDKIEDILREGRFYEAVAAFLVDLPLFPFACLKGPVVRNVPQLTWVKGDDGASTPTIQLRPQMFWERVSPFDIYWSPGAENITDADVIQRHRFTRTDLNALLGLPGYDEDAIREVLNDYRSGLRDWLDSTDTERAQNEGRENPTMNQSAYIDALEFTGQIQGQMLLDAGMPKKQVKDADRDYSITSWVIGRHTIKTQLNPSPRQRHPYYVTSFEKVPGTVAGHGLPDLLEDIQEVCNATLRALVNNMAISSGPQVVVNESRLAPTENGDEMYPWKRWRVQNDPYDPNSGAAPITFFAPPSNAQELLTIYTQLSNLADEISAIPRYITGSSQNLGGAGRTASGLSMLMGNAEKVLQTVASNVDSDVMDPALTQLYDMVVLTDTSRILTGEETINVRGVNVAVQKETERNKQLQFLQITANPIDAPIIGELGRARVLRAVSHGLGLPDDIVPDDQTLQSKIDAQNQMNAAMVATQPPAQPGQPGQPPGPGQPGSPGAPGSPGQAQSPGQAPGQAPGQPPSLAGQAKPGIPPSPSPGALAMGHQAPAPPPGRLSDNAPPVNLQQQGLPFHG